MSNSPRYKPEGMVLFKYTGPDGFEAWGTAFPSGFIALEWIPQSVPDDEETIDEGHQSLYHSWSDFRKVCSGDVEVVVVLTYEDF